MKFNGIFAVGCRFPPQPKLEAFQEGARPANHSFLTPKSPLLSQKDWSLVPPVETRRVEKKTTSSKDIDINSFPSSASGPLISFIDCALIPFLHHVVVCTNSVAVWSLCRLEKELQQPPTSCSRKQMGPKILQNICCCFPERQATCKHWYHELSPFTTCLTSLQEPLATSITAR